jgi:hypothetical protein
MLAADLHSTGKIPDFPQPKHTVVLGKDPSYLTFDIPDYVDFVLFIELQGTVEDV